MAVYARAATAAAAEDKYDMFLIYIHRVAECFGVTKTREVFDKAFKSVPDQHLKALALKYAGVEVSLGEVDRARAIYAYGCQ
jgi:pre-mRNA-splicing factor SYF1